MSGAPGIRVLVVNPGSSSVKVDLLHADDEPVLHRTVTAEGGTPDESSLRDALGAAAAAGFDAVGVRVVHGGPDFAGPVRVDAAVRDRIAALADLAPLHQRPAVQVLDRLLGSVGERPVVACFDTVFHRSMPAAASTYAVPADWRDRLGVRRYGFHGLAHRWAAHRAAQLLGAPVADLALVTAHLGAGASLCAVAGGRSVDTTMGFTPTAGLVMATRSGDLDPAVPGWLVDHAGLSAAEVADALDHASGFAGLAGTPDAAAVLTAADGGDPGALLALDVWAHRLRAGVAAMVAALGRLDALVFSGGIGENSPRLRALAVDGLGFLGLELADGTQPGGGRAGRDTGDRVVSARAGGPAVVVVHAREDLVIAADVRSRLSGG